MTDQEHANEIFKQFIDNNKIDPKSLISGWAEPATPQESPPNGELSKGCSYQINNDPEFGFLLIRQKNYVDQLINTGRYKEARHCLTVLCELWTKSEYKYKYDQLIARLNEHRRKHPED
jgi:hypothetical protein